MKICRKSNLFFFANKIQFNIPTQMPNHKNTRELRISEQLVIRLRLFRASAKEIHIPQLFILFLSPLYSFRTFTSFPSFYRISSLALLHILWPYLFLLSSLLYTKIVPISIFFLSPSLFITLFVSFLLSCRPREHTSYVRVLSRDASRPTSNAISTAATNYVLCESVLRELGQ